MNIDRLLSTGQVAKRLGINVRTVYRWEKAGKLRPVRLPSGQRRFSSREVEALLRARIGAAPRCAVYARVSSEKQAEAGNLDRQRERLLAAARERGYKVAAVIAERASGLNERRRGLRRLFRLAAAGEIDVVLVEFKDRLARFGFAYVTESAGRLRRVGGDSGRSRGNRRRAGACPGHAGYRHLVCGKALWPAGGTVPPQGAGRREGGGGPWLRSM